jgi:hypothetical protein
VHAFFGTLLLLAGISAVADDAPGTVLGWIATWVGGALVVLMIGTGLRLGLGEPVGAARAAVMIVATLLGGLTGAFLMALPGADFGR